MFGTFKNRERRSPKKRRRFQPRLETLEDRTVPTTILTGVDMSTMAATIGGYPPAGPTHLYLNFEGGGVIASAGLSDQQIQDTLYRTSEIYAPFNVEVSRLYGSGTADTSGDGSTTVFVGNNTTTAGYSFTPPENSDYPHVTTLFTHRPNSDGNDVAYVASGAPAGTARGVAHEAGHTFGLVHVRTDVDLFSGTFNTDPMPLGGLGTVPDIMSYTGGNNYFKDQSLPITNFNNGGSGVPTIEPSFTPFYMDDLSSPTLEIAPSTQNSYAYLQTVLGERPAEPGYRVANADTIDPPKIIAFQPQTDTLPNTDYITHSGTISRLGDYEVNRWTATRDETLQVRVHGYSSSSLKPVLLVYTKGDASTFGEDRVVLFQDSTSPVTSLKVVAGTTYYFVVGGQDGNSTGDYTMDITQERHLFFVSIDSLTDPIHVDAKLGYFTDDVKVRIAGSAGLFWADNVYYQNLPVTANEGQVKIEIDVERNWHGKTLHGTPKLIGDEWYVDFHDGTGLHDLHYDSTTSKSDVLPFCTTLAAPPATTSDGRVIAVGQVWTIDVTYYLDSQTISAMDVDKGVHHPGLPGKPITFSGFDLPGFDLPNITFTINMDSPGGSFGSIIDYLAGLTSPSADLSAYTPSLYLPWALSPGRADSLLSMSFPSDVMTSFSRNSAAYQSRTTLLRMPLDTSTSAHDALFSQADLFDSGLTSWLSTRSM